MDPEPSRFVFEDVAQELSGSLRRYLERLVGNRARRRLKEALDQECNFYRDQDNVFRCDRKPDC
jgi:hypothetical protein